VTRDETLDKAKALINGERARDYGDAFAMHGRVAESWNWWLKEKINAEITADDVAMMMVLLKMARLRHNRLHEDSYCDMIGYAALAGEIALRHGLSKKVEE
jgi:hypothetical protein